MTTTVLRLALSGGTLAPVVRVTRNPELYDRRFDDFAARAQRFTGSLSRQQRAAVASRSRFRNQPWLRRVGEIDADDEIPGLVFPRARP